jgi:hypothetical protein
VRDDAVGLSVIEPAPENNFADPTMLVVIPTLGAPISGQITEATARRLIRELEIGMAACRRINFKTRDSYRRET